MDLVIMAAGMGSRFGGLKQAEPINDAGDFILDYSVFDALRFGFDRVIFIIKEENYELFKSTIGNRIADKIKVEYVFQKLECIPNEFSVPKGREKPWGTGHAILCCKDIVKSNFAVINADDFYGKEAICTVANYLKNKKCNLIELFKRNFTKNHSDFALVGYKVKNTLTENGTSKRGVCFVGENGFLKTIIECTIDNVDGKYSAAPLEGREPFNIDKNQTVSMNLWGFTPKVFKLLDNDFADFLKNGLNNNPLSCEYLLPSIIQKGVSKKMINVKVINTPAVWYGITYKNDKPIVVNALKSLTSSGEYPENLWK